MFDDEIEVPIVGDLLCPQRGLRKYGPAYFRWCIHNAILRPRKYPTPWGLKRLPNDRFAAGRAETALCDALPEISDLISAGARGGGATLNFAAEIASRVNDGTAAAIVVVWWMRGAPHRAIRALINSFPLDGELRAPLFALLGTDEFIRMVVTVRAYGQQSAGLRWSPD